jgi:hypothetical protein
LIVGGAGAGHVLADSHFGIEIVEVNAEGEYVVLENTGGESVNLSGYTIDFEYLEPDTQTETLPEGTTLDPGARLVVATGAREVPNADVTYENDNHRLNNEDPDAVALLAPGGEVVASREINTTTTTTTTTEEEETTTTEEETTTTTEEEEEETTTMTDGEDTDGGSGGGSDGEEEPTASVTFEDQDSEGVSVVVQNASLSDGGYLVIHDESGAVRGHSAYLDPGDHSNVDVSLEDPIASTQTLLAMAHVDDGDQTYEFPDADGPYTAGGAPVVDDACITLVC